MGAATGRKPIVTPLPWTANNGSVYYPAWRSAGWAGGRYHQGNNKKSFDAELCAPHRSLKTFELRNETTQQFTVSSDSMAAIDRAATDGTGSVQRFAAAMIEVGERIQRQGNSAMIGPWWGRRK